MQDLSIKNAAKEGISLGKPPVQFVYIIMLQGFKDTHLFLRIRSDQLRSDFFASWSRISDPGSRIQHQQKGGGGGEVVALPFFAAKNFTKLKFFLFFNRYSE
jgi:hypothetical protein